MGNLGGVVSLRGTTYTDWCVQQVPLGPDRLKKKIWGAKVSSSGGFCVLFFVFLCTAGPEGMSCNASPVHDGFVFSRGLCFSNYGLYISCILYSTWNEHKNGRRFSCMTPVEVYAHKKLFFFHGEFKDPMRPEKQSRRGAK